MIIEVITDRALTATEKTKIKYIFKEAKCPNEVLKRVFLENFKSFDGHTLCLSTKSKTYRCVEEFEVTGDGD